MQEVTSPPIQIQEVISPMQQATSPIASLISASSSLFKDETPPRKFRSLDTIYETL